MAYGRKLTQTKRPIVVPNVTTRLRTGHHTMYVTIGYLKERLPFEIFTQVGHADPCEHAYLEAVSRCISIALQYGVPAEEFVDQLRGIRCVPGTDPVRQRFISSPADGIAVALNEFIKGETPE